MKPKHNPGRGRYVVQSSFTPYWVWGFRENDEEIDEVSPVGHLSLKQAEIMARDYMPAGATRTIYRLVPVRRIPATKPRRRAVKKGK